MRRRLIYASLVMFLFGGLTTGFLWSRAWAATDATTKTKIVEDPEERAREQRIQRIQRKLDDAEERQQQMVAKLDAILEELRIVKVRVSR